MKPSLAIFVSSLITVTVSCSHGPPALTSENDFSGAAIRALESQFGFRCKEKSGASGKVTLCIGRLVDSKGPGHPYPAEIGIAIPPKYRPQEVARILLKLPEFNRTVFVNTLELSTWVPPRTLEYRLDEPAYQEYDLWGEFIHDRIVIIPYATQNCDEYMEHLTTTMGFRRFFDATTYALYRSGLVKSPQADRIIVAAQSGSYRPLAKALRQAELAPLFSEIYLFDAIFGGFAEFAIWLKEDPSRRLWAAYNVPFTEVGTQRFANELKKPGVPFFQGSGPDLSREDLVQYRVGLVKADQFQTHQSIYARYFGYFLAKKKITGQK